MKIRKKTNTTGANAGARAAFSLVEVMVAVGIIATVFVAIFGSMTLGLGVTQTSRENMRATQIMLDKMEGIRLYNWAQANDTNFLVPNFTNWFYETNGIGQSNAAGNGIQYIGSISVGAWPFTNGYSANMRKVIVSVTWTNGGITHNRSMTTYVSLPGLQNYVYND